MLDEHAPTGVDPVFISAADDARRLRFATQDFDQNRGCPLDVAKSLVVCEKGRQSGIGISQTGFDVPSQWCLAFGDFIASMGRTISHDRYPVGCALHRRPRFGPGHETRGDGRIIGHLVPAHSFRQPVRLGAARIISSIERAQRTRQCNRVPFEALKSLPSSEAGMVPLRLRVLFEKSEATKALHLRFTTTQS